MLASINAIESSATTDRESRVFSTYFSIYGHVFSKSRDHYSWDRIFDRCLFRSPTPCRNGFLMLLDPIRRFLRFSIQTRSHKGDADINRRSLESESLNSDSAILQATQDISTEGRKLHGNANRKRPAKSKFKPAKTMKAYLFVFNDSFGPLKSITDFLDTRREVLNWLTILPHSIVIVSDQTVNDLTQIITNRYPGLNFLVSEIEGAKSNGYLPNFAWQFINNLKSSGRWV